MYVSQVKLILVDNKYIFCSSPIQDQKQKLQQGTGSVKKIPRNSSVKSPGLPTPPGTPSTIDLDNGKLKNLYLLRGLSNRFLNSQNLYLWCRKPKYNGPFFINNCYIRTICNC